MFIKSHTFPRLNSVQGTITDKKSATTTMNKTLAENIRCFPTTNAYKSDKEFFKQWVKIARYQLYLAQLLKNKL